MADQPTPVTVNVPDAWATDDNFKSYFKEENGAKSFDLDGLSKSYLDTQAKVKAIPAAPDSADAYKFEFPQGWPLDEADVKLQREMALEAKLTPAQYEAVAKYDVARMTRAADAHAAKLDEAREALKKEWGQKYQENLDSAKKALAAVFGPEVAKDYNLETDTDPRIIKGMLVIAKAMSEDTLRMGSLPSGDTRPLGEDGKARIKFKSMGE